jgi:hypothetical protein
MKRIFKDSFSPAMKNLIVAMSDAEYLQWEKDIGLSPENSGATKADGNKIERKITVQDIEKWADSKK